MAYLSVTQFFIHYFVLKIFHKDFLIAMYVNLGSEAMTANLVNH
jgi:hypothetical protein